MNQALNCARVGSRTGWKSWKGAKKVKVCSCWEEGVGGVNDRGGAAPAATGRGRKLMPAPSVEPLLPASDAPLDKIVTSTRERVMVGTLSIMLDG